MSAVQLTDVGKSFGDAPVLQSIDLLIPAGSRTVIVGPSGSGKTTLLRLLSGFEKPDTGTISVGGKQVASPGSAVPAHRRDVGHVAQDGALFPHLTVGDNIAFGLRAHQRQDRQATVATLLGMVDLDPGLASRWPDQLSGGQQQRVAVARALARRPKVMLLDEPFTALDSGLRAATRAVVSQTLGRAGITTVLVTHDRAEALSFADQLAVLRAGRLVQVGSPRDLYAQPDDVFTALFLGDGIVLDATVDGRIARCALGAVDVASATAAGACSVMLRPEQLRVEKDHAGIGQVESTEFHGSDLVMTVRLDLPSGQVVAIRQSSGIGVATADRVARGDRVAIRVLGPAVVLPPDAKTPT